MPFHRLYKRKFKYSNESIISTSFALPTFIPCVRYTLTAQSYCGFNYENIKKKGGGGNPNYEETYRRKFQNSRHTYLSQENAIFLSDTSGGRFRFQRRWLHNHIEGDRFKAFSRTEAYFSVIRFSSSCFGRSVSSISSIS